MTPLENFISIYSLEAGLSDQTIEEMVSIVRNSEKRDQINSIKISLIDAIRNEEFDWIYLLNGKHGEILETTDRDEAFDFVKVNVIMRLWPEEYKEIFGI